MRPAQELDRPIALCGFMGVGKSSIGRRVADALGREFVDADEVISARLGRPIHVVFEEDGEQVFRDLEATVIAEYLTRRPAVVLALGGGALGRPETRYRLLDEALLVHLDQPFEELRRALPTLRRGRPVLSGKSDEEVAELFEQRRLIYAVAPVQVRLERQGLDAATREVLSAIDAAVLERFDAPRTP